MRHRKPVPLHSPGAPGHSPRERGLASIQLILGQARYWVPIIDMALTSGNDFRAERYAIRQLSFDLEAAIVMAIPFQNRELDSLLGPDSRHMRMGEIRQTQVGPNRFRHVDDYIAGVVPGTEDANLGFALWPNSPIKEADARMPASGVGQHQERRISWSRGLVFRTDVELCQGSLDIIGQQAGGGRNLRRCERWCQTMFCSQ